MPDPVKPDYLNFPPVPDEAPWKKWLRDKGWGDLYVGPPPAAGAGGEKSAATEDPMAGTAYEGDSEFLQALVDAIKSGDLSKFLQSYSLSRSEYAAITKFIDSMSQPGLYTSDEEHVSTTDSEKLKQQLAVAALPSAGLWTAQKEYRSQRDAYNDLVRQLKEANDGVLPEGFPAFEAWAALQGGLKSGVIARGTQFVISPTEQYVAHTGETWRSIADERGINIAELMKANGATNPDEDVTGAMVSLPPASALGATNGRGEQTMPQSNPDVVNPDDPNNPGSTDTPGGGGLKPGELEKGDPWLNSLYEDSFGTDKLGRLIDELITNENYTPGTSSRYERLLRKNAGLLEFGLQMDPASADTGMGTAIAGLMDQIRGGQGIDAWSLINQAAGGDPEYKASFEGDGFDPSNVASILALARSGMVPDEALRSLYQGDYITGLYNDWERANQGQGDVGTFLAYLMSKGL